MANIYQGVGDPRDFDEVQYGNGQVGRKVNGGWSYDFAPGHIFQDVLGDNEVAQQMQLQAGRSSGLKLDEGDAGALKQLSGEAPIQNQSPAQQWNAQPAAPAPAPQGQSQLMQLLMQRAQQGPVSATDPNVRAQVDPAVAQLTRESRNYIDDVAEQAGPLANIQGERRLASERTGQQAAQLEGEVLGRETDARRNEIQQALSQWGAMLSDDQRTALQRELSYLNDSTQRAGLAQQGQQFTTSQNNSMTQFLKELALRENNQNNTWDYNWATLGL